MHLFKPKWYKLRVMGMVNLEDMNQDEKPRFIYLYGQPRGYINQDLKPKGLC